ncbi:MAG: HAMP domain-containing histidine kinase [Gemmataceae bacterium]|nr:HAMP domain-containing histidine kinase [Gemmataceae bacterium]
MAGQGVGRAAAGLPWLCPKTDSLVRLAEAPAGLAPASAADPALLAFLIRFAPPSSSEFTFNGPHGATAPQLAAALLSATTAGWVPGESPAVRQADDLGYRAAVLARRFAERAGRTNSEAAAALARLAPLGWYAVAAVDPAAAASALGQSTVQNQLWGLDHADIVRRLVSRWRFPAWAADTLGALGLPWAAARPAVADPDLFAVVRLAVIEAERHGPALGLTDSSDRDDLARHLGLAEADFPTLLAPPPAEVSAGGSGLDLNPHRVPLVRNLLRMAAEARRRSGAGLVGRLEARVDELHTALAAVGRADAAGRRDAKLAGLAELAAGAGHEINNPLAVISGQAQRLLKTEADPDRADALRSVVRQTKRIADLLRELRLFARPPAPVRGAVAAADLLAGVWTDVGPLADERGVRLDRPVVPPAANAVGDPDQLRRAVGAVVRNAVEAAGAGGWVGVRCELDAGRLRVVVDDSGPGLSAAAAEHAFDPFYSGRSAGRGRGLGLPTAWRLARENGGDVRHEPSPSGVTRFVVTLPAAPSGGRAAA